MLLLTAIFQGFVCFHFLVTEFGDKVENAKTFQLLRVSFKPEASAFKHLMPPRGSLLLWSANTCVRHRQRAESPAEFIGERRAFLCDDDGDGTLTRGDAVIRMEAGKADICIATFLRRPRPNCLLRTCPVLQSRVVISSRPWACI